MKKKISSSGTFFHKFILPVLWILVVVGNYLAISFVEKDSKLHPWLYWSVITPLTLMILYRSYSLKQVQIDDNNLYISNFNKELIIPLNHIEEVRQSVIQQLGRGSITVILKGECEWGKKFIFIPPARFINVGEHPLVSEIRTKLNSIRRIKKS